MKHVIGGAPLWKWGLLGGWILLVSTVSALFMLAVLSALAERMGVWP